MQLINITKIEERIYNEINSTLKNSKNKPTLGIILANSDESSLTYVGLKKKKAEELGINVIVKSFESIDITPSEILSEVLKFNQDPEITGFLIQLPIYNNIRNETQNILDQINHQKDVDGLGAHNLGKLSHLDKSSFLPATVEATLECINQTLMTPINWLSNNNDSQLEGKNVVIINNSDMIGKPLCNILISKNATVSVLNHTTEDIKAYTQNADIVITATGRGLLFDHSYFKKESTLIDITSKKMGGKVVGDIIVSPELEKINWLTPVPGGIGPLTVAFLMKNLVKAFQISNPL